jgi:hypothetical protein
VLQEIFVPAKSFYSHKILPESGLQEEGPSSPKISPRMLKKTSGFGRYLEYLRKRIGEYLPNLVENPAS